jgi:hypothetical protein
MKFPRQPEHWFVVLRYLRRKMPLFLSKSLKNKAILRRRYLSAFGYFCAIAFWKVATTCATRASQPLLVA